MGRCSPERLMDMADILKKIAAFDGVKEKTPGTYYYKATPFLHFHVKDEIRWADVKYNSDWVRVDIPFGASQKCVREFFGRVQKYYREMSGE